MKAKLLLLGRIGVAWLCCCLKFADSCPELLDRIIDLLVAMYSVSVGGRDDTLDRSVSDVNRF